MKNIKRKFADALELPQEILLNLPLITITGRHTITIENYKGIIEYDEKSIRINTGDGILKISGENLLLKNMTYESITLTGCFTSVEFLV